MHYKYTDKEINELLKSLVIIQDTREKSAKHITDYFDSKKINYVVDKLSTGDYSCYLPENKALGIERDTYFDILVERKNSIDEFAGNTKEDRFENELIRSQSKDFILVIEDSYDNLVNGVYRSQYKPQALLGRLKSFESKYGFNTLFMEKRYMGNFIYHHIYYKVRNILKGGLN